MTLPSAEVELEVPFHDVDSMEVVWHGHYLRYLEIARGKLLDAIDYNYRQMRASGYAWPVIEVKLRYPRPARFQQKLRIRASLTEYEPRLRIDYLVTDAETGVALTKARTIQVAVDMRTGELQYGPVAALTQRLGMTGCDPPS